MPSSLSGDRPPSHQAEYRVGSLPTSGAAVDRLDQDPVDSVADHVDDLEAEAEVLEALADVRNMSEPGDDQAAERVVVVVGRLVDMEEIEELVDREPAVEQPRAVA